jgi:hypothetical protein
MQRSAPLFADVDAVPAWGRDFGTIFKNDRMKIAETVKMRLFYFYSINFCYLKPDS